MEKVQREAKRRQVKLLVLPTSEAIQAVNEDQYLLHLSGARFSEAAFQFRRCDPYPRSLLA